MFSGLVSLKASLIFDLPVFKQLYLIIIKKKKNTKFFLKIIYFFIKLFIYFDFLFLFFLLL